MTAKRLNWLLPILLLALATPLEAAIPKYKRALVLAGGGFQTPIFLGIVQGALESEHPPDVIIGTCGGTVAAGMTNAMPDMGERKNYLLGDEYFNFLGSLKLDRSGFGFLLKSFFAQNKQAGQKFEEETIPQVFKNTMMDLPQDPSVLQVLNRTINPEGIPVILGAGELLFGPEDAGKPRNGRKLFQQVYFTDPATATLLEGFESKVATERNAIEFRTRTITDKKLFEGVRSSISDFYGTTLEQIDGKYYVTGAIDLYPIELAHHVADEVIMVYKRAFNPLFEKAAYGVFRYYNNERLRQVHASEADYWVDITDTDQFSKIEFGPKLTRMKTKLKLDVPKIPKDREKHPEKYQKAFKEYQERFGKLFEYGRVRALEGLSFTEKNYKCHVRQKSAETTDFSKDPCPRPAKSK